MFDTQIITCISCPVGCRMTVTLEDGQVVSVVDNNCSRGAAYARQECVAPMRTVTAVFPVVNSRIPVSIKTENPIPKNKIDACMQELSGMRFQAPILMGDVLVDDIVQTGVRVVATKSIK